MKPARLFPRNLQAESLTNPWIQYAGWPAFWVGLILCSLQAIISALVCTYYPYFMTVEQVACQSLARWVPAVQILISVLVLASNFFVITLLFKRKVMNPCYFLSAALLAHTIYFFHFIVNALFVHIIRPLIVFGPDAGKLISDSIWYSINFIFVAWFYALLWSCLREIGGLKGSRLGIGFILSVGLSGSLVTLIHWSLGLGPIP